MEGDGGRAWGWSGGGGDDLGPGQTRLAEDVHGGPHRPPAAGRHRARDGLQLAHGGGVVELARGVLDGADHPGGAGSRGGQRDAGGGGGDAQHLPVGLVDEQPLPPAALQQLVGGLAQAGQQDLAVGRGGHGPQRLPVVSHKDPLGHGPPAVGRLSRHDDALRAGGLRHHGRRRRHPPLRGHDDVLGLRGDAAAIGHAGDGNDAPSGPRRPRADHPLQEALAVGRLPRHQGRPPGDGPLQQRVGLSLGDSNDLGGDRRPGALGVGALNHSDRRVRGGALADHHLPRPETRVHRSDIYHMRGCGQGRNRLGQRRLSDHNLQQQQQQRLTLSVISHTHSWFSYKRKKGPH